MESLTRTEPPPRRAWGRLLLTALLAIAVSACATVRAQVEGRSATVAWRATELGVIPQKEAGQEFDAYAFTLVITETRGTALTFTRVEKSLDDHGILAGPEVETGRWFLPAGAEWRIPIQYSVACPPAPAPCAASTITAPRWRIRLSGSDERGAALDVGIDVRLPAASLRIRPR